MQQPMAVELLCSEISLSSPQDPERSESNSQTSDSDFCFRNSFFVPELPSADELFFNGKIRPKQPNRQIQFNRPSVFQKTTQDKVKSEEKKITRLKEFLLMSDVDDDAADREIEKFTSFWQFKRSSSLNCDRTQSRSLIKSSLRFLGRSNSTGSAPDPKPRNHEPGKRRLQKQQSVSRKCSVPSGSGGGCEFHGPTRKPPLKNWKASGVRVSPVLSLPQLFMTNGTVDLFGFSSLFCNGKVKKKKR